MLQIEAEIVAFLSLKMADVVKVSKTGESCSEMEVEYRELCKHG